VCLYSNSISGLLNHCCHGKVKSEFSLFFTPKYAAVNNTDIESVARKRQKCINFSVNVEIKKFCYFYLSSVILSAKFHFSRRERFYDKFLSPATMKRTEVFTYCGQYLHLILTTLGFT